MYCNLKWHFLTLCINNMRMFFEFWHDLNILCCAMCFRKKKRQCIVGSCIHAHNKYHNAPVEEMLCTYLILHAFYCMFFILSTLSENLSDILFVCYRYQYVWICGDSHIIYMFDPVRLLTPSWNCHTHCCCYVCFSNDMIASLLSWLLPVPVWKEKNISV